MIKSIILSATIAVVSMSASFNASAMTSAWRYTCFASNGSIVFAGVNTYSMMLLKKQECKAYSGSTFITGPSGDLIER